MTMQEIQDYRRDYLTPAQVASVLGCDPQDIRVAAKEKPGLLGFNVTVIGTRIKIPRLAFIAHMTGEKG